MESKAPEIDRKSVAEVLVPILSLASCLFSGCEGAQDIAPSTMQSYGHSASTTAAHVFQANGAAVPAVGSDNWVPTMKSRPPSKEGCFQTSYPSEAWTEVPCARPPTSGSSLAATSSMQANAATSSPQVVGNLIDFLAVVNTGVINSVEGNFPWTNNIQYEYDAQTGIYNSYCLQVNSNGFQPPACAPYRRQGCYGWQQFEYSSVTLGGIFIEYWIFKYGGDCTKLGLQQADPTTCHLVSTVAAVPLDQASLGYIQLYAFANAGGNDQVWLVTGPPGQQNIYLQLLSASTLSLYRGWKQAEFNVFGDWNYHEAVFNPGAWLEVQTTVAASPGASVGCLYGGFTGEWNNLTLYGSPTCYLLGKSSSYSGGIYFYEYD